MERGRGLVVIVRDTWLNTVAGSALLTSRARVSLLRLGGVTVGRNVGIASGQWFAGRRVTFGDGVYVNHGCLFDAGTGGIVIEDGVRIGPQAAFLTGTHHIGGPEQRAGDLVAYDVTIGRGTWVGARAVVMPGVSVAPGCVIGAGAVVTADTEPDGVYVGVPARRVRSL